jgi:hypothetical protein
MTLDAAQQNFDFRWTVLGASSVLLGSISLLQLSRASGALVALVTLGMLVSGTAARRLLKQGSALRQFLFTQRIRMAAGTGLIVLAATINHSNRALLMILAAAILWLVSVSAFLQIGTRYAAGRLNLFPYVQYIGDLWIAIFLAVWGADWMVVAGVLAIASSTAMVAAPVLDRRLLPMVLLSVAALFLFGIPPAARLFAIYMIATISLSTWGAHHLVVLANHLRGLTVSASDGSATH